MMCISLVGGYNSFTKLRNSPPPYANFLREKMKNNVFFDELKVVEERCLCEKFAIQPKSCNFA